MGVFPDFLKISPPEYNTFLNFTYNFILLHMVSINSFYLY